MIGKHEMQISVLFDHRFLNQRRNNAYNGNSAGGLKGLIIFLGVEVSENFPKNCVR